MILQRSLARRVVAGPEPVRQPRVQHHPHPHDARGLRRRAADRRCSGQGRGRQLPGRRDHRGRGAPSCASAGSPALFAVQPPRPPHLDRRPAGLLHRSSVRVPALGRDVSEHRRGGAGSDPGHAALLGPHDPALLAGPRNRPPRWISSCRSSRRSSSGVPTFAAFAIGTEWGFILIAIGGVLSSLITEPIAAIVYTLIYFDLRIRNEGFDLDLMSRDLATWWSVRRWLRASSGRSSPVSFRSRTSRRSGSVSGPTTSFPAESSSHRASPCGSGPWTGSVTGSTTCPTRPGRRQPGRRLGHRRAIAVAVTFVIIRLDTTRCNETRAPVVPRRRRRPAPTRRLAGGGNAPTKPQEIGEPPLCEPTSERWSPSLASRGLVNEVPGRTTGEYRVEVDTSVPTASSAFSSCEPAVRGRVVRRASTSAWTTTPVSEDVDSRCPSSTEASR